MRLEAGSRLGPYAIESPIGAGGMGEVYRARDTRLDRTVAIKVLAPSLAADVQFRTRFTNEARTISVLDHPNICALFDVGEQDGTAFLVMQYLEGETLATRLLRGAMSLADALRTGREIADALAQAHRAGIVHRDLKPGNVMLTKSGAKLLDFGLARGVRPEVVQSVASIAATVAPDLTAQGTILGTFQYMAPEQLEAKETDARTDIFAFGAVLHEMLTGRRAFEGKSQASLIAAILEHEPPAVSSLLPVPTTTLDRIVKTCLAKNPDARWQSAADLSRELAWLIESHGIDVVRGAALAPPRATRTWTAVGLAAGIIIGLGISLLFSMFRSPPPTVSLSRTLVDIAPADVLRSRPEDTTTTSGGHLSRRVIALTPDGQTALFSALKGDRQQLYVRALDQVEARALAGTDNAESPFLSPDGKWVGFWASGSLRKVPLAGGSSTTICETDPIFGASWGSNDVIVFAHEHGGIWQVPAVGGTPATMTTIDVKAGEVSHRLPQWLPGNRAILFTVTRTALPTWGDTQVVSYTLDGGTRTVVLQEAADAHYVSTGHLVYVRSATLNAVPFDLQRMQITGGSVTLVSDLMQSGNMPNQQIDSGEGQFSVSESGSLAYVRGGLYVFPDRLLVWVDRTGKIEPLAAPPRAYLYPRLSPDGTSVLVSTQGDRNVWLYNIARGTLTRVTVEGRNMAAIWTRDGARITFGFTAGGEENLFSKPADSSRAAERLTDGTLQQRAAAWSPDGQTLAFVEGDTENPTLRNIMMLTPGKERQSRPFMASRFDENYPDFSPDGKWIAFSSNESGRAEVYVAPFPGPGAKVLLSGEGGHSPAWSRNGRELFYLQPLGAGGSGPYKIMSVPITNGATFLAGRPQVLFETPLGLQANVRGYDLSLDDKRFLMVQPQPRVTTRPTQVMLVQHWFDELRRRVPTN